jgi:predicted P-loop ATPase
MQLIHDGPLDIATGNSRKAASWRNREVTWSEIVNKCSNTHRTAETQAQYLAEKKTRQDEIKDIGGFVGGYLAGGKRKNGSVVHRSLITMDLDFADPGVPDIFRLLYDNAVLFYSTHKHTAAKPRLRIVLPLLRPVMCDEYEAICRRIAGELGIEMFDHTGYQPYRLMYWPSTSKDGEYLFEYQDGPWLDPDAVLSSYHNWKDCSEWPLSDRESTIVLQSIRKQQDPTEKTGIVGAFCRTYSISEVIEKYLSDVYSTTDEDSRYTYAGGSTGAGMVVYEDKWAYSHHGTDPISGKLCNSWDLLRLHKFGHEDERTQPDTPANKMPSYNSMVELSTKDTAVRTLLGAERLASKTSAVDDFADEVAEGAGAEVGEADTTWLGEMDVDGKGNYRSTTENIRLVLTNDPGLKGRLSLNLFEHREVALRNLPWRKVTHQTRYLTDKDDSALRAYIEKRYGISHVGKVLDAINVVMLERSFHPVRDYLTRCEAAWDGDERLSTVLIDRLGAKDNEYTREVTRKTLIAAVARIFEPGCKFDNVLTLIGEQGIGKSTIFKKLGNDWFSDSLTTVVGKDAYEALQGVWLVEMGELAGMKKAEVEAVKHFISKQVDRFRVAYGRRVEDFPRQCIIVATTNDYEPLRGSGGDRRFWPVVCEASEQDVWDMEQEEVDQIWGEAVAAYRRGEKWHLNAMVEQMAREVQAEHTEVDERVGMVRQYLDTQLPDDWKDMDIFARRAWLAGNELSDSVQAAGTTYRDRVCAAEIWCEVLGGKPQDLTKYNTKEVHKLLLEAGGWERSSKGAMRFPLYGMQRGYVRTKILKKQ